MSEHRSPSIRAYATVVGGSDARRTSRVQRAPRPGVSSSTSTSPPGQWFLMRISPWIFLPFAKSARGSVSSGRPGAIHAMPRRKPRRSRSGRLRAEGPAINALCANAAVLATGCARYSAGTSAASNPNPPQKLGFARQFTRTTRLFCTDLVLNVPRERLHKLGHINTALHPTCHARSTSQVVDLGQP
jgi:hypothetical protein